MEYDEDDLPEGFLGQGSTRKVLEALRLFQPQRPFEMGFTHRPEEKMRKQTRYYRKLMETEEGREKLRAAARAKYHRQMKKPGAREKERSRNRQRHARRNQMPTTKKKPAQKKLKAPAAPPALTQAEWDARYANSSKAELSKTIFANMMGRVSVTGAERTPDEVTLLALRARQYANVAARVYFDGAELDEAQLAAEQAKQNAQPATTAGDAPTF